MALCTVALQLFTWWWHISGFGLDSDSSLQYIGCTTRCGDSTEGTEQLSQKPDFKMSGFWMIHWTQWGFFASESLALVSALPPAEACILMQQLIAVSFGCLTYSSYVLLRVSLECVPGTGQCSGFLSRWWRFDTEINGTNERIELGIRSNAGIVFKELVCTWYILFCSFQCVLCRSGSVHQAVFKCGICKSSVLSPFIYGTFVYHFYHYSIM